MLALLATVFAALALWCSFGALAVVQSASGATRIAFLPPLWALLILLVAAGLAAASKRVTRTVALPLFLCALTICPWVPFHVPNAFLLCTGSAAVAVWLAVIVGIAAAHS